MNTIQVSTAQLMKLPLHIVQRIAGSKSRNKAELSADIAFQLESRGITFVEAEIDPWYVRIEYNGTKIGGIDTTRGKQDYTTLALTADNWSKDWEALILHLFASIDIRNGEQADAMQDQYEDETDRSLSQAEHTLKWRYPNSADRIISHLDETFDVELDNGKLTIVDNESGSVVLAEHNPESQTWKAYLTNGEFYAITHKPVQWLTHIANYRN